MPNPLQMLLEEVRRQNPVATNALAQMIGVAPEDQQRNILGYTYEGRPVLQNDDGSVSTEESLTVSDPRLNEGRMTNIPSVWGGRRYDEYGATELAASSGTPYQGYDSVEAAERAAEARTARLGEELDAGRWWEGRLPKPKRKPSR